MSVCRSCRAPIVWVETEATKTKPGRAMPVDADDQGLPAKFDDGNLVIVARTGDLKPIVRYVKAGPNRLRSHFASCPERDTWRKGKKAGGG